MDSVKRVVINLIFLMAAAGLLICGCAQDANAFGNAKGYRHNEENGLEVHYIDVGQGDAAFLSCGGEYMLIDAGDDTKGTLVQNYLKKRGVESLKYLVLTHPDSDHIGGADVIITKFDVEKLYMSDYTKDNKTYRKLIDAIEYKNLKWETPDVGSVFYLGGASVTVLSPDRSYDNPNDSSIALLIKYGETSFLFTGDAEQAAEENMLDGNISLSADVYKAGHHGSRTSSSDSFIQAVNPEYVVISCGEGNTYGHPHAETLNKLRKMGVKLYRTDEQGSLVATSDGKNITWNAAPSETWKSGEPSGGTEPGVLKNKGNDTPDNKADKVSKQGKNGSDKDNEQTNISYILNTNTMKFHYPECPSVKDIHDKNRKETDASRDEIISEGYSPCKRCNP